MLCEVNGHNMRNMERHGSSRTVPVCRGHFPPMLKCQTSKLDKRFSVERAESMLRRDRCMHSILRHSYEAALTGSRLIWSGKQPECCNNMYVR